MRPKTIRAAANPTSTTWLSIGDYKVEIPRNLTYEQANDLISIQIPQNGSITISGTQTKRYATRRIRNDEIFRQDSQGLTLSNGFSIELLNPKILDVQGHLYLKAVLRLYSTELPEMSFAANTKKESPFLEKCVMNGKYCTLLLKRRMALESDEVIAALSYQILPPDTQYAEIPLAAVSKSYQHKGVGSFLFNELQRRLQDVGVLTIFCWGDQESEKFWLKQGFLKVAEVDGHGKPRKLPIKSDVRRAMSIPGSATLLVSHLCGTSFSKPVNVGANSGFATTPPRHVEPVSAEGSIEAANPLVLKASPAAPITTPTGMEFKTSFQATSTPAAAHQVEISKPSAVKGMMPLNIDRALSSVANENAARSPDTCVKDQFDTDIRADLVVSLTLAPQSEPNMEAAGSLSAECLRPDIVEPSFENQSICSAEEVVARNCGTLTPSELLKENVCQGLTQRSRKRERCASQEQKWDPGCLLHEKDQKGECNYRKAIRSPKVQRAPKCEVLIELPDSNVGESPVKSFPTERLMNTDTEVNQNQPDSATDNFHFHAQAKHAIMFMNIADSNRRLQLTKFVEKLGGIVTNNGNECTHVVTGEARRTLNLCTALCTGAWVLSPAWLKESVKENTFVEEAPFILNDNKFELKYRTKMEDVIRRAKERPCGLLQGFRVYPTRNVQPPVETISAIILSAGGTVLRSLSGTTDPSCTIVIACEDDISEALVAAKAGLPTYSSEWLMCCVMKQDLDLTTTQFAESL